MNVEGAIAALAIVFIGVIAYLTYGRKYARFMGVLKPEEYLNIVPLAYLEHEENKKNMDTVIDSRHSLSDQGQALLSFMIHDPAFLSDWRTWKHEEILFWFVHVNENKYQKYNLALGKSVPDYLTSGSDLKHVNDLVLRNLGISNEEDRKSLLEDLDELRIIEKPDELWAQGAADVDSLIRTKGWLQMFNEKVGDGKNMDWFDKMSTEMSEYRKKSSHKLIVDLDHTSATTTI